MLMSGTHSKIDAFLTWAWDYVDRDHAATVEASSVPQRIAWGDDDQDAPHISLDRPEPAGIPARHETNAPDRGTGSARTSRRPLGGPGPRAGSITERINATARRRIVTWSG
jgi:hypothetical protein